MEVRFLYGRCGMKADLPDDVVILKQKPFPKLSSTADALVHALSNPLGAPRIPDQFREGDTVSVIINDHTRPIPTREILDVLLPMLKAYRVQLTIATGLHATPSPSDLEEILGGWSTSGLPI
jgi:nickel-dependent lactate racemase